MVTGMFMPEQPEVKLDLESTWMRGDAFADYEVEAAGFFFFNTAKDNKTIILFSTLPNLKCKTT